MPIKDTMRAHSIDRSSTHTLSADLHSQKGPSAASKRISKAVRFPQMSPDRHGLIATQPMSIPFGFLESLPQPVLGLDPHSSDLWHNAVFGRTFLGSDGSTDLLEDQLPTVLQNLREDTPKGQLEVSPRKDIFYTVRFAEYAIANGAVFRYGVFEEISQYRRTINRIAYAKESFQELVEGIVKEYVVFKSSISGRVSYASPSCSYVLGRTIEELIDRTWPVSLGLSEAKAEPFVDVLRQCEQGKNPKPFELELELREGKPQTIEFTFQPVCDFGGKPVAITGIIKDITLLAHTRTFLVEAKQTLEATVRQRTAELRKANHQLAVLGETKNNFLQFISHELRTPLNGITGVADLLIMDAEEYKLPDDLRQVLDTSVRRLISFIDDVDMLMHVEYTVGSTTPSEQRLSTAIDNALNEVQESLLKTHKILTDIAPGIVLKVHQQLFQRALKDLIEIGLKFCGDSSPLHLSANTLGDECRIVLTVFETTLDHYQSKYFFEISGIQEHTTMAGDLGLRNILVSRIIRLLGGDISLRSEEDRIVFEAKMPY